MDNGKRATMNCTEAQKLYARGATFPRRNPGEPEYTGPRFLQRGKTAPMAYFFLALRRIRRFFEPTLRLRLYFVRLTL